MEFKLKFTVFLCSSHEQLYHCMHWQLHVYIPDLYSALLDCIQHHTLYFGITDLSVFILEWLKIYARLPTDSLAKAPDKMWVIFVRHINTFVQLL